MSDPSLLQRLQQLEDRAALKLLVDRFAVLADRKDVDAQVQLFTDDAVLISYVGDQVVSSLQGREAIGQAFGTFLAQFTTVYHLNGQHTVELHGDRATGTHYGLAVLLGKEEGRDVRYTHGVVYTDEYLRRDGQWLIAHRLTHFAWRVRDAS